MSTKAFRVAACHASPRFLSAALTTEKCISFINTAASNGANLIVFPESFIPAFPIWSAIFPPTQNHDFFKRMVQESIYIDGDQVRAIQAAAKKHAVIVSVGISEKVHYSSATLFNTNLIISTGGEILVHHRKLMPTFFEKLTWSSGDGHGLEVVPMPWGKVGALICGENTNPLARYALMAQGEQVHISTWPAIWPTREGGKADEEKNGGRNYDNVAANRTRAAAHCFEAKCFGVLCAAYLDREAIDVLSAGAKNREATVNSLLSSSQGVTMFLDPTGAALPGFFIDAYTDHQEPAEFLQKKEGILYADLDMADCIEGKQ